MGVRLNNGSTALCCVFLRHFLVDPRLSIAKLCHFLLRATPILKPPLRSRIRLPSIHDSPLDLQIAAMFSRRLASAARMVPLRTQRQRLQQHPIVMLPSMMQTVRNYADKMVQVPQMAESISEGTLKQFSKGVGDFVEQDEELATIETDKASISNSIKC